MSRRPSRGGDGGRSPRRLVIGRVKGQKEVGAQLRDVAGSLGGTVCRGEFGHDSELERCTVLVVEFEKGKTKQQLVHEFPVVMHALLRGVPVVRPEWIIRSVELGHWALDKAEIEGLVFTQKELDKFRNRKPLDGLKFAAKAGVEATIKSLVKVSGGTFTKLKEDPDFIIAANWGKKVDSKHLTQEQFMNWLFTNEKPTGVPLTTTLSTQLEESDDEEEQQIVEEKEQETQNKENVLKTPTPKKAKEKPSKRKRESPEETTKAKTKTKTNSNPKKAKTKSKAREEEVEEEETKDDTSDQEDESSPVMASRFKGEIKVSTSGFEKQDKKMYETIIKNVKQLTLIDDEYALDATHIVIPKSRAKRTLKVALGIARGAWIVSTEWLLSCLSHGCVVAEEEFERERRFPGCVVTRLMKEKGLLNEGLLAGKKILLHGKTNPSKAALTKLIHASNGVVTKSEKNADVVVAGKKSDPSELKHDTIVSEKWIFDGIEKAEFTFQAPAEGVRETKPKKVSKTKKRKSESSSSSSSSTNERRKKSRVIDSLEDVFGATPPSVKRPRSTSTKKTKKKTANVKRKLLPSDSMSTPTKSDEDPLAGYSESDREVPDSPDI